MYRLALVAMTAVFLSPLGAQSTVSSIRISADPPGPRFFVDGQKYMETVMFFWQAGTRHVVSVEPLQGYTGSTARSTFVGWEDPMGLYGGSATTLTITADPSLTYLKAVFEQEYLVSLNFFGCTEDDISMCNNFPGTIYVNGTAYHGSAELWLPAGSTALLRATPNPGYVFAGWGAATGHNQMRELSIVLDGPRYLYPRFEHAVDVTVASSPPGLKVAVDRTPVTAPFTVEWGGGTNHTLGPVSPQMDNTSNLWVFDSWSNGAAEYQVYTVPSTPLPQTITANYVRGARVSFLTNPSGLKLVIDGIQSLPPYNLVWGIGSTHSLSAPLEQVDSEGRRYLFREWSNGADASQQITVGDEAATSGFRLIATYEPLGQLTVRSSPTGLTILMDGTECVTPCTVDRPIGSQVPVAAPSSVLVTEGTRLDFDSWSDGALRERNWTVRADPQTITAAYRTCHQLRALAEPPGGTTFRFEPSTADGFYVAGTRVSVFAKASPGYRFLRWMGDLSGLFIPGVVTLSQPRTVVAKLERVPYIAPAGVGNAAAQTPKPGVAAGSIISIYGASLAPALEAGPVNPLAQTIAGVTVRLGDRLLPLFFVSPEQINALLPSDLEEGTHTLTARWEGHPEVSATFPVVRNAPGLFTHPVDSRPFAAGQYTRTAD